MRVPIGKFSLLFSILQAATMKGSSVLVLVACDVDALAGARLLKVRLEMSPPTSLLPPKFLPVEF